MLKKRFVIDEIDLKLADGVAFVFVHLPYIILWSLYFSLFGVVFSFTVSLIVYGICFFLAFLPISEKIIALFSSYRPLRTSREKEKLIPLFQAVREVTRENGNAYRREVILFIDDTMDINAFAFGRNTLCVSRGALELLSEEELIALLGHEMGHFYNNDTMISLFLSVAIFPITLVQLTLEKLAKYLEKKSKKHTIGWLMNILISVVLIIPTVIRFVNDLATFSDSRYKEYRADNFVFQNGFGEGLVMMLYNLDSVSFKSPEKITEYLKSTHPPLTARIEKIERALGIQ